MCDFVLVSVRFVRSRVDYGCVQNPSLVLLFNQNLSPITVIIGCKLIGINRLVQSSEARESQNPIDLVIGNSMKFGSDVSCNRRHKKHRRGAAAPLLQTRLTADWTVHPATDLHLVVEYLPHNHAIHIRTSLITFVKQSAFGSLGHCRGARIHAQFVVDAR